MPRWMLRLRPLPLTLRGFDYIGSHRASRRTIYLLLLQFKSPAQSKTRKKNSLWKINSIIIILIKLNYSKNMCYVQSMRTPESIAKQTQFLSTMDTQIFIVQCLAYIDGLVGARTCTACVPRQNNISISISRKSQFISLSFHIVFDRKFSSRIILY